jgi:L-seryl-tRNA(Ser) seleniumtransferase
MSAGDDKIVADRVYQILSVKRTPRPVEPPTPPAGNVSGHWKVDIQFAASKSMHTFDLLQDGGRVRGTHQGNFRARDLTGTVEADKVQFATRMAEGRGENLGFRFSGTLAGDAMSGTIDMGEYLEATFTAKRQA